MDLFMQWNIKFLQTDLCTAKQQLHAESRSQHDETDIFLCGIFHGLNIHLWTLLIERLNTLKLLNIILVLTSAKSRSRSFSRSQTQTWWSRGSSRFCRYTMYNYNFNCNQYCEIVCLGLYLYPFIAVLNGSLIDY